MKRWVWLTAGLLVLLGLVGLGTARLVGRRGSRASALIAVVTAWLAAWILWGFAGGLAAHYGALERYDGTLFTIIAVLGGIWQYRIYVRKDGKTYVITDAATIAEMKRALEPMMGAAVELNRS